MLYPLNKNKKQRVQVAYLVKYFSIKCWYYKDSYTLYKKGEQPTEKLNMYNV